MYTVQTACLDLKPFQFTGRCALSPSSLTHVLPTGMSCYVYLLDHKSVGLRYREFAL